MPYGIQLTGNMTAVPQKTSSIPIDPLSQLVKKASCGCSESFGQLVKLHQQTLRLFLSKFIQCSASVDDIAQEVFLVSYRQLATFRHEAEFSTWLLGIARNKALEFLRTEVAARKNRNQLLEVEIAKRKISRLIRDKRNYAETQEHLDTLQSCLDQLPVHSKSLVTQYYFEQRSAADIAPKSSLSGSAIRMKLLRIRRVLRKCMSASSRTSTDE